MATVATQCRPCGGTGVYRGFAEPRGVGVLCCVCGGTGCKAIEYTPFTERQVRLDIHTVRRSMGRCLPMGVGPAGGSVSYVEFKAGRMPGKAEGA